MCAPFCRDDREQAPEVARKVADLCAKLKVDPSQMTAYLHRTYGVARFFELCYSHALGVHDGLKKGILVDTLRIMPKEER